MSYLESVPGKLDGDLNMMRFLRRASARVEKAILLQIREGTRTPKLTPWTYSQGSEFHLIM